MTLKDSQNVQNLGTMENHKILNVLSNLEEVLQEIEDNQEKMESLEIQYRSKLSRHREEIADSKKFCLGAGFVAASLFYNLIARHIGRFMHSIFSFSRGSFAYLLVNGIDLFLSIFIGWIVYKYVLDNRNAKNRTKLEALKNSNNEKIKILQQENDQIVNNSFELLSSVPFEFLRFDAVNYMKKVLFDGRADTFKEAMHLTEQFLHNNKVLKQNEQLLRNSEDQAYAIKQLEDEIRKARASAEAAERAAYWDATVTMMSDK